VERTLGEVVQPLADAAAGRGRGIVEAHNARLTQCLHPLLGPAAALLVPRRLHGGGTAADRLARFGLRVQHPPGGLAGALVLNPHKAVVQRQIVTYGVL